MQMQVQDVLSDVVADRRRSNRTAVEIPVHLFMAGVRFDQCLMKDLSDEGARILVPHGTWIPSRFSVACPNGEFRLDVEKVWANFGNVGIRFLRAARKDSARLVSND